MVSNQNSAYNYAYSFDPIGNRLTANLAGTAYNYTTNMLNQYTVVNSNQPTYDDDGNMLTNGSWTYTWNGENRMIQAVNGNTKLQFVYDYMGRRIEKKVFDGDTIVSYKRYVYDDYKQVEELDALNSNSVLKRYSWQPEAVGLDVPLSMTDVATAKNYAYTLDANKNVSDLTDAQGNVVAHYEYSPFGTHTATGSYTGNPFRFSSEVFDSETGLIYYNYRYYNPNLGRWINRDPIEEQGGWNLYVMVGNNASANYDLLGNGIGNWLLTGNWNATQDEYNASYRAFEQNLNFGLNKWLYTGDWNPSDDIWDAATIAAGESARSTWVCYSKCLQDFSPLWNLVGSAISMGGFIPIPKKQLGYRPYLYKTNPYTTLWRHLGIKLSKHGLKRTGEQISKISTIYKRKGISGKLTAMRKVAWSAAIAVEASISIFCTAKCYCK